LPNQNLIDGLYRVACDSEKEFKMQDRIGIVAGNIWKRLETDGEMSPRKISATTKEKSDVVYLALGWLARENKVEFNATKSSFKVKLARR